MLELPERVRVLLWDLDVARLHIDSDADSILARVLEHGTMAEIHWLIAYYGGARIRAFFENQSHPIISARTRGFWHAYFKAEQPWPSPPAFRTHSNAPWTE
jgi:hypothetical protein